MDVISIVPVAKASEEFMISLLCFLVACGITLLIEYTKGIDEEEYILSKAQRGSGMG